jgi:hypothetical protein
VYGIQSLPPPGTVADWNVEKENIRMLSSMELILDKGVVPTYTVYHTSGRNTTGRIPLSSIGLWEFTREYGKLLWSSGIIDRHRGAVLFTIGSLPNTTYNDGWILAELEHRRHGGPAPVGNHQDVADTA